MAVHTRIYGTRRAITRVDRLAEFEGPRSQTMLNLGFQLARAQQDSHWRNSAAKTSGHWTSSG